MVNVSSWLKIYKTKKLIKVNEDVIEDDVKEGSASLNYYLSQQSSFVSLNAALGVFALFPR